jgi:hypothetical protein
VHADVLLERTLGLSANYERVITYKDKEKHGQIGLVIMVAQHTDCLGTDYIGCVK